jgi:hypothetical protein
VGGFGLIATEIPIKVRILPTRINTFKNNVSEDCKKGKLNLVFLVFANLAATTIPLILG